MTVIVSIATAIGMVLAIWMQGRAAHMNPVAVFIGLLFFGWLWGGWGLLLGVPILAVLKSIADRVESDATRQRAPVELMERGAGGAAAPRLRRAAVRFRPRGREPRQRWSSFPTR